MADKKLPTLSEVFLVTNRNLINVGSAYSRKLTEADRKLRPELKKVVDKYAEEICGMFDWTNGAPDEKDVMKVLERFAHEMEGAEGEDPAELDQGGPQPGTTGGDGE